MKKILLLSIFSVFVFGIELDSVKADFKQTIFKNNAKIVYDGILYFKDNKNLWKYKNPTQKKVYLNDDLVVIVDDELEQVIFEKLNDKINITNILKNAKDNGSNHYQANYANINYDIFLKDEKNIIINYLDENKNKVVLELFNVLKNQNIDDSTFVFDYPSDYDILR